MSYPADGSLESVLHAQADLARGVLQFTVAVGGAGEAVERVVADVQLHYSAAQALKLWSLRADGHAR